MMTKEEYERYYKKRIVGLDKDDEEKLDRILKKIEFSDEEKRILDAFYIPNTGEKFKPLDKLTPSQMKAELRNIFVLLKYNYCGYDYFNRNGELDIIHQELDKTISIYNEPLESKIFFKIVINELHKIIKDNHFYILCDNEYFCLEIHNIPYFTDLIVEEVDGKYVIINDNDFFPKHYVIKDNIKKYIFKTLPENNHERFLIGLLQLSDATTNKIRIDGIELPLHQSRSTNVRIKQDNKLIAYKDYNMLLLTMCHINEENSYKGYYEYGEKLKDGKCAVISVVGNPGGNSNVCNQIIQGLNGNGTWNIAESTLNLFQKSGIPFKYYSYSSVKNKPYGTYEKPLYILMNSLTASAGESMISICNNVKDVIKIGTNTMGCGCFGEVQSYILPQSHAKIGIPYKTFFMEGFTEGTGFMPDYWMDDENMIESFTNWLNKKMNLDI